MPNQPRECLGRGFHEEEEEIVSVHEEEQETVSVQLKAQEELEVQLSLGWLIR